jgi:predicted secreted hydrolase
MTAGKPRSLFVRILRFLGFCLVGLLIVIIVGIAYGIADRGLHQDEYVSYPFYQVPVQLPGDHAAHPDFKTEWWYYTGHLFGQDGHRYGFELTFFHIRTINYWVNGFPVWWFMYPHGMAAHFAITDVDGKKFYYADLLQKNSSDDVGAKTETFHVWLQNWFAKTEGKGHHLFAGEDGLGLELTVVPAKPPVLHGENGYHWKGVDGIPSNYITYSRLAVDGKIKVEGRDIPVTGQAWMDHEYTSFKPRKTTQGWDWFAIQLDSGYEVMLYQMHRTDGSVSTDSTGSIIDPEGTLTSVTMPDYRIETLGSWTSPQTGATYPSKWRIHLPNIPAELTVTPTITEQEMRMKNSDIVYWEGACDVTGDWAGEPVKGLSYVELSGYVEPISGRF